MKRSHKNKENKPACKDKPINGFYKVSKRLFDSKQLDNSSPEPILIRPPSPYCVPDDSPYIYEILKKRNATKILIQGAATSVNNAVDETPLKRSGGSLKQRFSFCSNITEHNNDVTMESPNSKSVSRIEEIENSKHFTSLNDEGIYLEQDLTFSEDFTQECTLTVIKGKHPELHTISGETVAHLLVTRHDYDIKIIDCRYPYEFKAGHIKNAINWYFKPDVEGDLFNLAVTCKQEQSKTLLIFYCEFSSERAPNMMRFIRNRDRRLNADTYPFVYYPELYLIDGGYKSFYAKFKELCEPQDYKPMLAKENTIEYAYFKSICKMCDQKLQKE